MQTPKFRLIAGPNASGKTYLFNKFRSNKIFHTEIYVNADQIEKELRQKGKFIFNAYRIKTDETEFKRHIYLSGLFNEKIKDMNFLTECELRSGVLLMD